MEHEGNASTAARANANQYAADYVMMFDLIGNLVKVMTETEAIEEIFDLFTMLFAPRSLVYAPVIGGKLGDFQSRPAFLADDEAMKSRLTSFDEDYAWTGSGDGFLLRIGYQGETLGVLAIEGIAFPEYKEHYLNLALTIVSVCGLAIANARIYQQIKQTEEELRLFKTVVESSQEAIAISDPEGQFVYINPAHEKLFGRSLEEARQVNYRDYYPPESIETLNDTVAPALARGESWEGELDVFDANGRRFPLWERADSVRDAEGKMLYGFGFMHDITEQKQMEEALRESEKKFRNIIEAIPLGMHMYQLEPDGRLLFIGANPAADQILGVDNHQFVGKSIEEAFPALAKTEIPEQYRLVASSGQVWQTDQIVYEENQIAGVFGVHAFQTSPGKMVAAFLDITGRKRAETEIRQLNEELEQHVKKRTAQLKAAYQELEAAAYTMSHDLRTPLRAINGFSQILLEDYAPQLPAEAQDYLNRISHGAQRMGELIDGLLSYLRLGRQPLEKKTVSPVDLIHKVLAEIQNELAERQVEFTIGQLPECQADPVLLERVFFNLLSNALKYTHQREVAKIEVGWTKMDDQIIYFVKDNGVGFDMQYAHKLFGLFQQLHRVDEYEGTGIGLATVQRIIHRHGGRVWAEGVMGQGATFYFTL